MHGRSIRRAAETVVARAMRRTARTVASARDKIRVRTAVSTSGRTTSRLIGRIAVAIWAGTTAAGPRTRHNRWTATNRLRGMTGDAIRTAAGRNPNRVPRCRRGVLTTVL
jgi:enolase